MTRTGIAMAFAAALVAVPPGVAAAQPKPGALDTGNVRRVVPLGKDGVNLYYRVQCTDGRTVGVRVDDAARTVCAHPRGAVPRCEPKWTLRDAAAFGCAQ